MGKEFENVDRISELPICILHNILFYLPPKEQARTSILSKSWYTLVWSSLPQHSFAFDQGVLLGTEPALLTNDSEKQKYLVNHVDLSLQRLQNERFKIPIFTILIQRFDLEISASIDSWLQLLAKNHLRCLLFATCNYPRVRYMFPKIALASTVPLQTLSLTGCRLQRNSLCHDDDTDKTVHLPLRVLDLIEVVVDNRDNIFQKFISRCSSLLYLNIKNCCGLRRLRLANHSKLEELHVQVGSQILGEKKSLKRVEVVSLNLHTIKYMGMRESLIVQATRCRNLRRLHITNAKLEDNYLENIYTNFPLLHSLSFISCVGLKEMEVLHHPMLKWLRLSGNDLDNLSVIDAPNLISFRYSRYNLKPSKLSLSNASSSSIHLKEFCLKFYLCMNRETTWFLELRTYLGQFASQKLTISLDIISREYDFITDELREVSTLHPLFNVEQLELLFSQPSPSYDGLVDGLFWCFRPKSVHVSKSGVLGNDFGKILLRILTAAKEQGRDSDCCSSRQLKCWSHFLKDFTVNDTNGVNLLEPLQNFACNDVDVFTLSWL